MVQCRTRARRSGCAQWGAVQDAHSRVQHAQSGVQRTGWTKRSAAQDAGSGVKCRMHAAGGRTQAAGCVAGSKPQPGAGRGGAEPQRLVLSRGSFKTAGEGERGTARGGGGARAAPGGAGSPGPCPRVLRPMSRPPAPPPGSPRRFGALSTAQLRALLQDEPRLQRAARLSRKVRPGAGGRVPQPAEPSRAVRRSPPAGLCRCAGWSRPQAGAPGITPPVPGTAARRSSPDS